MKYDIMNSFDKYFKQITRYYTPKSRPTEKIHFNNRSLYTFAFHYPVFFTVKTESKEREYQLKAKIAKFTDSEQHTHKIAYFTT